MCCVFVLFFFFKQTSASAMRIRDWSSDVCSSDVPAPLSCPRLMRSAPPTWPAFSRRQTDRPRRAAKMAMVRPAGPAPAMTISYVACGVEWAVVILFGIRHQRSQVGFGYHNVIMTLYQAARISFLYDDDVRNIPPFAASCGDRKRV